VLKKYNFSGRTHTQVARASLADLRTVHQASPHTHTHTHAHKHLLGLRTTLIMYITDAVHAISVQLLQQSVDDDLPALGMQYLHWLSCSLAQTHHITDDCIAAITTDQLTRLHDAPEIHRAAFATANRQRADTIGTVPVPWADHFQC